MTERQRSLPGFERELDPAEASAVVVDQNQGALKQGDLTDQTVYIVDAHALIYQVFHAMPDMTSPSGQSAGAIHGFVRDVLENRGKENAPIFFFCAFDHPGGETFSARVVR